ncbi:hypothetical protein, partial [Candidatus Ichthyocystis hellenicum]|uniref:hypothetical protein n=1 Tax=Candidatus Ichthyocystis hellenicum TaxID=1561003 RepID=UPI001F5F086F
TIVQYFWFIHIDKKTIFPSNVIKYYSMLLKLIPESRAVSILLASDCSGDPGVLIWVRRP